MSLNQDVKAINADNVVSIVSKLDEVQVELVSGLGSVSDIQENYALWMCHAFTVLNTGVDRATMTLADYSIGKGVAIHQLLNLVLQRDDFVLKHDNLNIQIRFWHREIRFRHREGLFWRNYSILPPRLRWIGQSLGKSFFDWIFLFCLL